MNTEPAIRITNCYKRNDTPTLATTATALSIYTAISPRHSSQKTREHRNVTGLRPIRQ